MKEKVAEAGSIATGIQAEICPMSRLDVVSQRKTRRFAMFAMMRRIVLVLLAVGFVLSLSRTSGAQTSEKFPFLAAVTAEQTAVRAGAASRYYSFGSLDQNDLVQVVAEKVGWARVRVVGPAFDGFFGYLKFPRTEAARFQLDSDGKTGVTLGLTSIYAPNLDEKAEPARSWKPIAQLPARTKLTVLKTDATDLYVVHTVRLPKAAEGWIDMTQLKRASLEQITVWDNALNGIKPAPGAQKPQTVVAKTSVTEPVLGQPERPTQTVVAAPGTRHDTDRVDATTQRRTDDVSIENPIVPQTSTDEPNQVLASELPASLPIRQANDTAPVRAEDTKEQERVEQIDISNMTLEDLESAYARLLREPLETAEVLPLRRLYTAFAREHSGSDIVAEHLGTRVQQLQIWSELQEQVVELNQLRNRAKATAREVDAVAEALQRTDEYVAVGRLHASTIYDGKRLPKLLRLRDPRTGRTVGYLRANQQVKLPEMLGQLLGIVGEKSYDGGLQLNLLTPRRIDMLQPRSER